MNYLSILKDNQVKTFVKPPIITFTMNCSLTKFIQFCLGFLKIKILLLNHIDLLKIQFRNIIDFQQKNSKHKFLLFYFHQ